MAIQPMIFALILKFLDVSHNLLTSLPDEIGNCPSLVEIRLNGNQIERLPESIGMLENLESLNLSSNQLETLPRNLSGLRILKSLNLESNNIHTIPDSIGHLEMLSDLNLAKNQIQNIEPGSLENLRSLVQLDIHQNKLTHFVSVPASDQLDSIILAYNFIS